MPTRIRDRADFFESERGLDALRARAFVHTAAREAVVKHTTASGSPASQAPMNRDPYSDDAVLLKLEVDSAARVWGYQKAWLCSPLCLLPCVSLPLNVVCCPTVYVCCCFPQYERRVANAHSLVLRERTLLFTVAEHASYSELVGSQGWVPACCEPGSVCCGSCGTHVPEHTKVIRLAERARQSAR